MRLYLVEIGGLRAGSLFESHEVHAVCAIDEASLIEQCHGRFGNIMRSPHIDGWISFEIHPRQAGETLPDERLFVIELGQNAPGHMRERHDYRFMLAANGKDAARTARTEAKSWHVDAVIDLDELAAAYNHSLRRTTPGEVPVPDHQSRYLRLISGETI